jgi:hypothetical protein
MIRKNELMGHKTRSEIVELCRTEKNIHELVEATNLEISSVRRQVRILSRTGWIETKKRPNTSTLCRTVQAANYPPLECASDSPDEEKQRFDPPGVRTYRMEDFKHRKYPLRPQEFRGIGSTLGMETA